ncbi:MAG: hypothetical protein ABJ327_17885 [Litoreibacter sp.]
MTDIKDSASPHLGPIGTIIRGGNCGDPIDLSYTVGAMVRTCKMALENDGYPDSRNIYRTADVALTLDAISAINGQIINTLELSAPVKLEAAS